MGDGQLSNAVDDVAREHVGVGRCGVRVDGWLDGDDHRGRVHLGCDLKDVAVTVFSDSVAVGIDVETAGRDRKAVDDDPTFVDRSSAERLKASEVECQVDMVTVSHGVVGHRLIICHSVTGHRIVRDICMRRRPSRRVWASAIGAAVVCAGSAPEAEPPQLTRRHHCCRQLPSTGRSRQVRTVAGVESYVGG